MNILLITIFFVGFMVPEIHSVSVFGQCPYSVTFPYIKISSLKGVQFRINLSIIYLALSTNM